MDFQLSFSSSSLPQGTGESGTSAPVAGSTSSRSAHAREKAAPIGSCRGPAFAMSATLRTTTEVGRSSMETPRSSVGSAAGMDRRSTTSETMSRSRREQGNNRGEEGVKHRFMPVAGLLLPTPQTPHVGMMTLRPPAMGSPHQEARSFPWTLPGRSTHLPLSPANPPLMEHSAGNRKWHTPRPRNIDLIGPLRREMHHCSLRPGRPHHLSAP